MAGMSQAIGRRIDRLEERLVVPGGKQRLCFLLSDWGGPLAFEEGTNNETIAEFERMALERLVSEGRITEAERDRVMFIVNTLVSPPEDADQGREVQHEH
jgi:hypothetical protein